jgi:hypothetical protein
MPRSARRYTRRRTRVIRHIWRTLRLTGILSFLCLAVFAVGFALMQNAQVAIGQSAQTAATCTPTLIATSNPTQPEKWFSINSGSAADIVSAAKCTDMFQSALQGNDLISNALQNGTLGTPVLVKPYRQDVGMAQFWVVPVVASNTHPLALLTFFYNPRTHLIHEGEFDAVTGDMFYASHAFPAVTATDAVAMVSIAQHVTAVQGQQPELIYFPGDFAHKKVGPNAWHAGGTAVIDPIWRVPGTDGSWHYVDHDGSTHMNTDLPVDPGFQPMPSATSTK